MTFSFFHSKKSELDLKLKAFLKTHFGFSPLHLQLYKQAIIHKSVTRNKTAGIRHSNERLEFLGDAILDAIIGDYLFTNYPDEDEGFLTKARSKLVSRAHLIHLAREIELQNLIVSDVTQPKVRLNLAGNALEALFGAMYIRKGFNFCKKRILKLIQTHTTIETFLSTDDDFKSRLFQWAQKNQKTIAFKSEEIPDKKTFEVTLLIDDEEVTKAEGNSKKEAERIVSKMAIKHINPK